MNLDDKGVQTQLANIQAATGRSLDELRRLVRESPLTRHAELRTMLQETLGLSHVYADTLVLCARELDAREHAGGTPSVDAQVDALYAGPKAHLRPIHDRLMAALAEFPAFERAPKKGYVSLRRSKQFATVGPATNSRVEVGLNLRGAPGTDRLVALPAGQICTHKVRVTHVAEVDAELLAWVAQAHAAAG